MGVKMEQEETERGYSADRGVKELQAQLFPINTLQFPKVLYNPGSFLGNFLLKTNQLDLSEDSPGTGGLSKLREQRELIALCRDLPSYQAQLPRWPTECQVLDERVEHIIYNPSTPEPFYLPTGKEVQPKPLGDEFGVVVFQYHPVTAINYFSRSCVGGCKSNPSTPLTLEDDDLRFESRFESGNLAKAVKLTATFYELHLRTDMYTNRHTQWFYFRITNVKRHILYRFSIVNLSKGDSLYNSGMKPLMYSTKDAKLHSIGWRRCGDNIVYFCNENGTSDDEPSTYTLTFTIEFPHDKDTVYLAHSYPYTYSDLQEYLNAMVTHPIKSMFCTLRLLCKSLAGNNIYYVTITTPQTANEKNRVFQKKRAIVITARVHPGETPSSWMMKGFLDFLTGDSSPARELRDKFIFKLVPMINPDGVIVGNSRCSLTGRDLNRQYRTVIRETYPPIWHIKLMIRRLIEECGVAMYCDLHAHSRQNDIFIYGCENRRNYDRHLHEQVFPLMLHKNAADKFSFESCKFRVQRCKEGAGRVVMWMMGISNSYTMEASFAGSDLGPRADTHFSVQDYEQMGKAFCQTLLDFYDEGPTKEKLRVKIIKRLLKEGSTADEPTNITLSDYSSDEGDSSSSEEEGGGHHNYSTPPNVPPTSPVIQSPVKIVPQKKKIPPLTKQNVVKSPTTQRKPLQMYQATLGLSLADDCDDSSSKDSNSDYESPRTNLDKRPKPSRLTRRQKTRKGNKICEHSDTEIQIKKHSRKRLNVLELIPAEKMRSQSWNRSAGFPQSRTISHMDGRVSQNTTKQLAEVQAKLLSLRHRLWTGMNDGDNLPISWGFTSYSSHDIPRYIVDYLKLVKALMKTYYSEGRPKNEKKKKTVLEKSNGNKNKKKTNRIKDDTRKSPKKKQNGIKRQKAVDLGMCDVPPTIYYKNNEIYKVEIRVDKKRNDKKGKSLDVPNTQENEETTNQDDTTKKKKSKKKKKYKNKWQKKVSEKIVPVKMQSVD